MTDRTRESTDEPLTVTDPSAVRVLIDSQRVRYLAPFVGQARSASEAARELDVRLDDVYGRVRRLVGLGLLDEVGQRSRAGRPVRLYRSRAGEFFVPVGSLPAGLDMFRAERYWQQAFVRQLHATLLDEWVRMPHPGVRVHRRADGLVSIEAASSPGVTWQPSRDSTLPLAFGWRGLRLRREDARELARRLVDLLEDYSARHDPGGEPIMVGAHLAPRGDL